MKYLARVVPVDLVGIGREPTEWSIEFVLGNKESRVIFVPDVVTEAVNREKERIVRMWCDVREACENALVAWIQECQIICFLPLESASLASQNRLSGLIFACGVNLPDLTFVV